MNKVLLTVIVFILTISIAYNLYQWKYIHDMNDVRVNFNSDLDKYRQEVELQNNENLTLNYLELEHKIKFINMFCFGEDANGFFSK